jgi:hypothetical protein
MELIIAIIVVAIGVAIWYNRRAPNAPVVEPETFSDNGIKFVDKAKVEEVNAVPIVTPVATTESVAAVVEKPTKAPAKKKAPAAKPAPVAKKKAPAKKTV